MHELAEILATTRDAVSAKRRVDRYLSRMPAICPTAGCPHGLKPNAFICMGYDCAHREIRASVDRLEVLAIDGRPLVIPIVCEIFSSLGDEKKVCRYCKAQGYCNRRDWDGLYCHGCGLFVDFEKRKVGYTKEWTISPYLPISVVGRSAEAPPGVKCALCERGSIRAKFGDILFCSVICMRSWFNERLVELDTARPLDEEIP